MRCRGDRDRRLATPATCTQTTPHNFPLPLVLEKKLLEKFQEMIRSEAIRAALIDEEEKKHKKKTASEVVFIVSALAC